MRIALLIIPFLIVACAKKNAADAPSGPVQPTFTNYQAPSNCTQTASDTFDFLEWDPMSATKYSCPVANGQTCELQLSSDGEHAQLICTGNATKPSSCVSDGTHSGGLHDFIDGTEAQASVADCGVWNNLRCMRFESATETEMRCLDNDLPYDAGFAFAN